MSSGEISTASIQSKSTITPTPAISSVNKGVSAINFNEGSQRGSGGIYPSEQYSFFPGNRNVGIIASGWNKKPEEFYLNPNGDGVYLRNIADNFKRNGTKRFQEEVAQTVKKMVEAKQTDMDNLAQIEDAKKILPEGTEFFRMPGVGSVCTIDGVTMKLDEAIAHFAA